MSYDLLSEGWSSGGCTEEDSFPGGAFGVAQSMGATQNAATRNKANKTKQRSFIFLSDISVFPRSFSFSLYRGFKI
jgi:hypothetical protein